MHTTPHTAAPNPQPQPTVPSPEPTPIWLTEKQVALLTSLSVSTLRNHRQRRMGIPYVKLGRSVRYAIRAVEEYMNAHAITY